jgi:internalin A
MNSSSVDRLYPLLQKMAVDGWQGMRVRKASKLEAEEEEAVLHIMARNPGMMRRDEEAEEEEAVINLIALLRQLLAFRSEAISQVDALLDGRVDEASVYDGSYALVRQGAEINIFDNSISICWSVYTSLQDDARMFSLILGKSYSDLVAIMLRPVFESPDVQNIRGSLKMKPEALREIVSSERDRLSVMENITDLLAQYHSTLKARSSQAGRTQVPKQSDMPEWYVSYAWGDDRTPEGRARKEVVDRLCDAAAAQGHRILRDENVLSLGDSISAFMKRIGGGDRVFVILSDKYLRSPFCMFELSEVWRMSKQQGQDFLDRVRVYALPDANISKPVDWISWAAYWKREFDELEVASRLSPALLGEHGHRRLMQMQTFYTQVADILGTLADIVQPRTFEELKHYGFVDHAMRKS